MESVKKAAKKLNVELDVLEVQRPSDFDTAFLMASQRGAGAMVMLSSPLVAPNVQVLAELALRHRFPAITLFPDFARAGGLLAYGPNLLSLHRLTGVLASRCGPSLALDADGQSRDIPASGAIPLHVMWP